MSDQDKSKELSGFYYGAWKKTDLIENTNYLSKHCFPLRHKKYAKRSISFQEISPSPSPSALQLNMIGNIMGNCTINDNGFDNVQKDSNQFYNSQSRHNFFNESKTIFLNNIENDDMDIDAQSVHDKLLDELKDTKTFVDEQIFGMLKSYEHFGTAIDGNDEFLELCTTAKNKLLYHTQSWPPASSCLLEHLNF